MRLEVFNGIRVPFQDRLAHHGSRSTLFRAEKGPHQLNDDHEHDNTEDVYEPLAAFTHLQAVSFSICRPSVPGLPGAPQQKDPAGKPWRGLRDSK
jgi:hypothetical protein